MSDTAPRILRLGADQAIRKIYFRVGPDLRLRRRKMAEVEWSGSARPPPAPVAVQLTGPDPAHRHHILGIPSHTPDHNFT